MQKDQASDVDSDRVGNRGKDSDAYTHRAADRASDANNDRAGYRRTDSERARDNG